MSRVQRRSAGRSRLRTELRRSRRHALVVATGLLLAVAAYLTVASRLNVQLPGEDAVTVRIVVPDARGFRAGKQEIRWAGIVVGRVTGVELDGGRAVLEARIDAAPEGAQLYRDARVRIRPQTPLEDMYVDIEDRGTRASGDAGNGVLLEVPAARAAVHIGEVLDVFDADTRAHMEQLIDGLGRGLRDGGEALRATFSAAVPWLQAQARLSRTLAERRVAVRRLVGNVRRLGDEVADHDRALARLVRRGGVTFTAVAAERRHLQRLLEELPTSLSVARRSFTELRGTLDHTRPALVALRPAARALPAGLRSLREFTVAAAPALDRTRPALRDLSPLARALPATAADLERSFAQLAPQVAPVERLVRQLVPCRQSVQKFFAHTLSVFKLGNRDLLTASPRATAAAGPDGFSQLGRDPLLRPTAACTGDRPAPGGRP